MVTLKLVKAWEEHGLMLFTQTTFMWKTKARPSLDVSVTTATEISILDQDNTVLLLQHAEKPVLIIHTLPCSTMAGAHATTRMVIQYLHTHKLMTKTAMLTVGDKVVLGLTQCSLTISTLKETSTHQMKTLMWLSVKKISNSSSDSITTGTELSLYSVILTFTFCFRKVQTCKEKFTSYTLELKETPITSLEELKVVKTYTMSEEPSVTQRTLRPTRFQFGMVTPSRSVQDQTLRLIIGSAGKTQTQ
jgi:hypothetical protein